MKRLYNSTNGIQTFHKALAEGEQFCSNRVDLKALRVGENALLAAGVTLTGTEPCS